MNRGAVILKARLHVDSRSPHPLELEMCLDFIVSDNIGFPSYSTIYIVLVGISMSGGKNGKKSNMGCDGHRADDYLYRTLAGYG